jgi:transcriptional regulator with XRE-family HTH domain
MVKIKTNKFNVGTRITKLRLARKWTQEDLAKEAGLPTTTVSIYERGTETVVDIEVVANIAEALGVAANTLLWASSAADSAVESEEEETKDPVKEVSVISSHITYTHKLKFRGKTYVISSSKDINPDRQIDAPYTREMRDENGDLVNDSFITSVLSRALGNAIKRIMAHNSIRNKTRTHMNRDNVPRGVGHRSY